MKKRRKVLVVDDDRVQLTVIRAWLESGGFEVVLHDSPIGTTQVVRHEAPDFILLDVEMPILSGPALVGTLMKHVKDFPLRIIFYSGKEAVDLEELNEDTPGPVLGAIRKTRDGKLFLRQFNELIAAARVA